MNKEKKLNPKLFTLMMFITSFLLMFCVILLVLESHNIYYSYDVVDNISYYYKNIKIYRPYKSNVKIDFMETVPHSEELPYLEGYYYYEELNQQKYQSSSFEVSSFAPGYKLEFDLCLTNILKSDLIFVVKFINELSEFDNLYDYFEIETDYLIKNEDKYVWNVWNYERNNKTKTIHYSVSIPITSNMYPYPFKLKIEILSKAI